MSMFFPIETQQESLKGRKSDLLSQSKGNKEEKSEREKTMRATTPALPPPQLVLHRPDEAPNLSSFSFLPLYPPVLSFLFSHLLSLLVNSPSPLLHSRTVTVVCSSISLLLTLYSCCTYLLNCFALVIPPPFHEF